MMTFEEMEKVAEELFIFHTKRAPGLVIAVAMVDLAREALGPVKDKLNAIAESQVCISDAIQVMTGCTIGNKYLRILKNIGRFALILFDRADGRGIRVSVDPSRIDPTVTPEIHKFFFRNRGPEVEAGGPAREESSRRIIREFRTIGPEMFVVRKVRIKEFGKPEMLPALRCPSCGETFLQRSQDHIECDFCSGKTAYFSYE